MKPLKITSLVRGLTMAQMLLVVLPAHAIQKTIHIEDTGSWTISLTSSIAGPNAAVLVDAQKPNVKALYTKGYSQKLQAGEDHTLTFSAGAADQSFRCDLCLTADVGSKYAGSELTFTATVDPRSSSVVKSNEKWTFTHALGQKPTVSWDKDQLKFGEPLLWIHIK